MYKPINLICSIIILGIMLSCASKKDIIYLQNDKVDESLVSNDYQLRFKPDDLLQITVSSEDIQASIPFNLPIISYSTLGNRAIGNPQFQTYLVDSDGYIIFPIFGKILVKDLTRIELIELLQQKISPKYVKDPIINVLITNFKVTIQGDVRRPGTYTLPNERYSIMDVIGLAGDLNISAQRYNIKVLREENGKKNIYYVDLRSKKILTSPVYYLQQNDVIYVEPNNAKIQDSVYNRSTGLFISMASVIISLITVLTR